MVIDEDLSGFLEVDTTLIFCKIKALLPDSGNKALYVIDKPHESWGCTNISKNLRLDKRIV